MFRLNKTKLCIFQRFSLKFPLIDLPLLLKMALKQVNLSTDVYFVCLNHAMSTDGEEIVGLLCGEVC